MSNIIKLAPDAADADDILDDAKGCFRDLIIIGWDKEGDFLRALTSSTLSSADTLYLMKLFEAALLDSALRDS